VGADGRDHYRVNAEVADEREGWPRDLEAKRLYLYQAVDVDADVGVLGSSRFYFELFSTESDDDSASSVADDE
jgi:hypothetical protein